MTERHSGSYYVKREGWEGLDACVHTHCPHYKCLYPDTEGGSAWLKEMVDREKRREEYGD